MVIFLEENDCLGGQWGRSLVSTVLPSEQRWPVSCGGLFKVKVFPG
jgi:hypothetical protein